MCIRDREDQSHDTSDLNNRVMGAQPNNVVKPVTKQVSDSSLGNLFTHSVVDSLLEVDVYKRQLWKSLHLLVVVALVKVIVRSYWLTKRCV